MADDIVPAENEQVVEDNNQPASPADEPKTSDSSVDEGQSEQEQITTPDAEETQEEPERKPSRAEKRIREQNRTIKDLENELSQRQNQPMPSTQSPQAVDVNNFVDENGNFDAAGYNQAVQQSVVQTASAIAQGTVHDQLTRYQAAANLENDVKTLPQVYPELDEKSQDFSPELLAAVEADYKERAFRVIGYGLDGRPVEAPTNARLSDSAKKIVEAARAYANRTSASVRTSVQQTADETAPAPGTPVKKKKAEFKDLSLEEMRAQLGYAK